MCVCVCVCVCVRLCGAPSAGKALAHLPIASLKRGGQGEGAGAKQVQAC